MRASETTRQRREGFKKRKEKASSFFLTKYKAALIHMSGKGSKMLTDDQEKKLRETLRELIKKWERAGNKEVVADLLLLHPSMLGKRKEG